MNKAVFIDKDGTLIPDVPYNVDPALITLEKNTAKGLRQLRQMGFLLIIISNQSGVARGYFEEKELENVKARIIGLLKENDIELDGFYFCPHHPEGIIDGYSIDCSCRKPKSGMFLKAAREHNIDLSKSWMIGDILNDVEAGNRAGCRTVLIDNGNETEWVINNIREPDFKVKNVNEAAEYILKT